MFLNHFGLQAYPFSLAPDPAFFYPAERARAVLDGVAFALARGDGVVKVVGEVGSGKTLLCRCLLERLKTEPINIAYVPVPLGISPANLALTVASAFGCRVPKGGDALAILEKRLRAQHTKKRRNVLVVDEAQALGAAGLEAIRLLSNLETSRDKLLQLVLFGQQELDLLLATHGLRQMAQRITFGLATEPLPDDAVKDYVRFRLARCAKPGTWTGGLFTESALGALTRASRGLPRLVHTLADKALIAAYADKSPQVLPRHVRAAAREVRGVPRGVGLLGRLVRLIVRVGRR